MANHRPSSHHHTMVSQRSYPASVRAPPSYATMTSIAASRVNKSLIPDTEMEYYISTSKRRRRFNKFRTWLYNPENGQVMNRTGISWLQILSFYAIFYGVLSALFAACLGVFMYAIIMVDYPYLTGMQSALQLSPGLGVVPQPDTWSSLIYFRVQEDSYTKYVDDIIAYTQWYENYGQAAARTGSDKLGQDTSDNGFAKCPRSVEDSIKDTRRSCRQSLNFGGRCNIRRRYGYRWGSPCVIVKLNRIYGWMPDPLDNHTGVIVKCYGRGEHDKENIGKLCYHDANDPEGNDLCENDYGEFKSYFFPYLRQLTYQSPLVMVEFINPMKNQVIMIECRAYAKNIPYNRYTGEGTVRFEILIE